MLNFNKLVKKNEMALAAVVLLSGAGCSVSTQESEKEKPYNVDVQAGANEPVKPLTFGRAACRVAGLDDQYQGQATVLDRQKETYKVIECTVSFQTAQSLDRVVRLDDVLTCRYKPTPYNCAVRIQHGLTPPRPSL